MKPVTWYCKLCTKYGIKHRITHLIDNHNAVGNKSRSSGRWKTIIEILFIESLQTNFDTPEPLLVK